MSKIKRGQISVETQNIFPVIRQWLYSEQDIFLRELLSNASDAIAKLERLMTLGEIEKKDYQGRINLRFIEEKSLLIVEDNGLGMSLQEIDKYINQIAFSGAVDFVNKYLPKDKNNKKAAVETQDEDLKDIDSSVRREEYDGIIGHFGLGFYSSFMVAEQVAIESKSYLKDESSVFWFSPDGLSFELDTLEAAKNTNDFYKEELADISDLSDLSESGTRIYLKLNQRGLDFASPFQLRSLVDKYCHFLSYPIYLLEYEQEVSSESHETITDTSAETKTEVETASTSSENETRTVLKSVLLNNTSALWLKDPKLCSSEEYLQFYREVFHDMREPLFWVHLNLDYPFKLRGIFYFPKFDNKYESLESRVKLYYNQVFVADNIKEIIPEYLFLLRGCIDCPDLPLNVSRSFLQEDETVKKISRHIVKKVADKLLDISKNESEKYLSSYDDLASFVQYASMRDDKFFERVKDAVRLKTADKSYITLQDLEADNYYANDLQKQNVYISSCLARNKRVLLFDKEIDSAFLQFLEYKLNDKKFQRVDTLVLADDGNIELIEKLKDQFIDLAKDEYDLEVSAKAMGEDGLAALLIENEDSLRMAEYLKQMEKMNPDLLKMMPQAAKAKLNLHLNTDSELLKYCASLEDGSEKQDLLRHIYDLAKLSANKLEGESLLNFLTRAAKKHV